MNASDKIFQSLARMAAGREDEQGSFWMKTARNFLKITGVEQKATEWMVMQALSNPNVGMVLYQARSHVNEQNAVHIGDFSSAVLLSGENRTGILLGLVCLGIVGNFHIPEARRKAYADSAASFVKNRDKVVKDVATVVRDALRKSVTKESEEAREALMQGGLDIRTAISRDVVV